MMKSCRISIFVVSAFVLTACSTQSIQQGKNLSVSGIAYTQAVDKLLDYTTDRIIDFSTEELKLTRKSIPKPTRDMVRQSDNDLLEYLAEIERFRSQTRLLETYFLNLQSLSDSNVGEDAGMALKSLSGSIDQLNKATGGNNGKATLSEEQKTQIGAMGKLVVEAIVAEKIQNALKRDAEIIGIHLALQENQLGNFADDLQSMFQSENDQFRERKVLAPFVDKKQPLGSKWSNNRKLWFKNHFASQQLKAAQNAAKQLRGVWADILQGKTDTDSLSLLIADMNSFVTVVQALDDADEDN